MEALQGKPPPRLKVKIRFGGKPTPGPHPTAGQQLQQQQQQQQQQQEQDRSHTKNRHTTDTASQRKRRLLDGYVGPSAQPSAIVECLQRGEPFSCFQLLPQWDESLALSACLGYSEDSQAKRGRHLSDHITSPLRPADHIPGPQHPTCIQEGVTGPQLCLPQQQYHHQHHHHQQQQQQQQEQQHWLQLPQPCGQQQQQQQDHKPAPAPGTEHAHVQEDPSGTSSSDNTISVALGSGSNRSPPEIAATLAPASSPEAQQQKLRQLQAHASSPAPAPSAPAALKEEGDHQLQHQQQQLQAPAAHSCSRGVQTAGVRAGCSILPSTLMQLRYASRWGDITTRDLRLPSSLYSAQVPLSQQNSAAHRQQLQPQQPKAPEPVTDQTWKALMKAGTQQKHEVDARRVAEGVNVGHVVNYVQSALKYMEACEVMVKLSRTPERLHSAGRMYVQTSDYLNYTMRIADTVRDTGCTRDALSLLCKRLSSVCLAREAALQPHRLTEYANRVQQLLHRSQQVATHAASTAAPPSAATTAGTTAAPHTATTKGAATATATTKTQPQHPSPDDSTTSSQDQVALGHPAGTNNLQHPPNSARPPPSQSGCPSSGPNPPPPHAQPHPHHHHHHLHHQQVQLPADMRAKLLACARQITRAGSQLKRTTHGFQAFSERPDVRQSRAARLACAHIAAVHVDYGLAGEGHTRAHALQALRHIQELAQSS